MVSEVVEELAAGQALSDFQSDEWDTNQSCCSCCFELVKSKQPMKQDMVLELAHKPLHWMRCRNRGKKISPKRTYHMHESRYLSRKQYCFEQHFSHDCQVPVSEAANTLLLCFCGITKCRLLLVQKRVNGLADVQKNLCLCSFCINLWSRQNTSDLIKIQRIISESKHWHQKMFQYKIKVVLFHVISIPMWRSSFHKPNYSLFPQIYVRSFCRLHRLEQSSWIKWGSLSSFSLGLMF